MNYNKIKALAKEWNCKVGDLFILAAQNDPFYIGTPTQIKQAEWWADVFHSHCEPGMHVRGCHYAILHLKLKRPDGKVYQNTKRHWEEFQLWSKFARHLGLVNPLDISDQRTGAIQNGIYEPKPEPESETDYGCSPSLIRPTLPGINAVGYEGDVQPYHLEVWTEKNDRAERLLEICQRYDSVLQIGQGYASITGAVNFLERVKEADKPARIFYITDYDPAGENMPRALSRHIEFYNDSRDIKVYPLMLSKDQIAEYDLPSYTDESLKVEINAFTTLHPNEFDKILTDALSKYYDKNIAREVREVERDHQKSLDAEAEKVIDGMPEIDEFFKDWKELSSELSERMSEFKDRFSDIEDGCKDALDQIDITPPDLPNSKQLDYESPSLYDSELDYFEQLERYKDQK